MNINHQNLLDLNGKEVDMIELLNLDGTAGDVASFLLNKIEEVRAKNFQGDEIVSNYHIFTFSFTEDTMIVSGLTDKDEVLKFRLRDFITKLKEK